MSFISSPSAFPGLLYALAEFCALMASKLSHACFISYSDDAPLASSFPGFALPFPCIFYLPFPINPFFACISALVLHLPGLDFNIWVLSSSISPHQRIQLLLFCFSLFNFHLILPAAPWHPSISQLWDISLSAAQSNCRCGVACSDTVPMGGWDWRNEFKFNMWELNTTLDLWRGGDNQCIWIHLGIYWQTLNRYPGRARVKINVHCSANYVYIFLGDGKKHIPWHGTTSLTNFKSLLQTIMTLKYSQKSMIGFVLITWEEKLAKHFFFPFNEFWEMADSF